MAGYQSITILGNLGRDPELRYLQSGVPVCNFSVAVTTVSGSAENRQEKTIWFRVAAWRQLAETCAQYLAKGRQVLVIGTVDVSTFTGQDGQTRASLEVTAREVRFVGGRGDGQQGGDYTEYSDAPPPGDLDDIPF